jgi:hypothetical protein
MATKYQIAILVFLLALCYSKDIRRSVIANDSEAIQNKGRPYAINNRTKVIRLNQGSCLY